MNYKQIAKTKIIRLFGELKTIARFYLFLVSDIHRNSSVTMRNTDLTEIVNHRIVLFFFLSQALSAHSLSMVHNNHIHTHTERERNVYLNSFALPLSCFAAHEVSVRLFLAVWVRSMGIVELQRHLRARA